MDYNPLDKTGLEVPVVSFGTAPLGDMFEVVVYKELPNREASTTNANSTWRSI